MSDDFHDHRIKSLIKGLVARTEDTDESKRLTWQAAGTDGYELALSRSSLRITADEEDGGWYPYIFSLLSESGDQIEEVYASSVSDDEFGLQELYSAASRSHRGVKEKLTEVFQELGIPDPPPPPVDPALTLLSAESS